MRGTKRIMSYLMRKKNETMIHLEIFHRNGERGQNFGVDLIVLQINEIHFFTNLLKSCLRTQRS